MEQLVATAGEREVVTALVYGAEMAEVIRD
jgi:hypothetical protein